MLNDESTPKSLAALYRRKRSGVTQREASVKQADEPPQLGLLFAEEPSAPTPVTKKTAAAERRIWTVRSLVARLRSHVESEYAEEWVEGEVSNCRLAPSGHLYFTLKDGEAQLPVVMFRRQAILLRFRPEDGMSVLVRGSVSVYESRGQLQLIAETLEPRGEGALRLAFEQLREKLKAEGLFELERKRRLPKYPVTIGVVTSTAGAVLRDIANICKRRHACLNLLVYPSLMQGEGSAAEVRAGIAYFNSAASPKVDLILIARGGGSAEDLWGFNEEALARTIAASELLIVSAIGHETDFTIADFVADLRAPTPSAAAELITEHQFRAHETLVHLESRLTRALRYQQMHVRQCFVRLQAGLVPSRIRDAVDRRQQHVDALRYRLENAMKSSLSRSTARIERLDDRAMRQEPSRRFAADNARWQNLDQRLQRSAAVGLQRRGALVATERTRLAALNPEAVLRRGYALVFDAQGKLLRRARDVSRGDTIVARLAEGSVRARVSDEGDE